MGKVKKTKDDPASAMGVEPVKMKKRKEKKEKKEKGKKKKEKPTEQKAPDPTPKEAAQNTETLDEQIVCLVDGGGVKTDEKTKKNVVRSKKDKTVEKVSVKEPPRGDAVATSQAPGADDSKSKSSKKKKSSKRKSLEAVPEVVVIDAGETGDTKGKKNKNNKEEELAPAGVQPEPSPAKSGAETKGESKKGSKDKCEEAKKSEGGGQTPANGQVSCAAGAPAKTKAEENGAKTTPKPKKKKSKRKSEAGLQTPNSTADGAGKSDAGAAVVPNENEQPDNGVKTADGSQQEKDGHKKVKSRKKSKRKSEAGLQTPNSDADGVGKSDTGVDATEKSSKKSKKKRKKSDVVEAPPTAPAAKEPPAEEGQPPEKEAKTEGLDEGPKPDGNGQIPIDLTSTEGEFASKRKEGLTSGAKAFRRVQADDWLHKKGALDNSYEATFGNEGWGAKAQEVLGKVRGKDFRHEKTKKKRGSYRGGVINSDAVNSTKFDSD